MKKWRKVEVMSDTVNVDLFCFIIMSRLQKVTNNININNTFVIEVKHIHLIRLVMIL
jgi:hypothetical protein